MTTTFEVAGPSGRLVGLVHKPEEHLGAPVVFIHPVNLRGDIWTELAESFEPQRQCIMPTLRGHGLSTADGPFGLAEWTSDLLSVMDALNITSAHLVGASLGGPLAIAIASRHPDRVRSITAIGSSLKIEGEGLEHVAATMRERGVRETFSELMPKLSLAPGAPSQLLNRVLELSNPNDADTVAAIWTATQAADVIDLVGGVRCPAVVISGEMDKTCTPEQGERMASALAGRHIVLSGVGHLPMVEAMPPTSRVISAHLCAADPPPAS